MITYLIINSLITFSALFINKYINIPYRTRFYLLMLALLCWLVPFGYLTIEIQKSALDLIPIYAVANISMVDQLIPKQEFSINWDYVLLCGIIIGIILFVHDLFNTNAYVSNLKKKGKIYKKDRTIMLVNNINNAFVSGYFKQIIWVDEKILNTDSFDAVIIHEKQHIKNHDQFWLFLLHLIQRIFWFNPLVFWLSIKTRKSIELSCDEICKNKLGKSKYQKQLAKLLLNQHSIKSNKLNNCIKCSNFNIERLNKLNEVNIMKKKQIVQVGLILSTALVLSLYSLISIASTDSIKDLTNHETLLELEITNNQNNTINKTLISNNNDFTYFEYSGLEIGVFSKVFGENKENIYNEFSIRELNNKNELARPSITTNDRTWGSFKIENKSNNLNLRVKVKATSNIAQGKLEIAVDKFITEKEKPFWQKYNENFENINGDDC